LTEQEELGEKYTENGFKLRFFGQYLTHLPLNLSI